MEETMEYFARKAEIITQIMPPGPYVVWVLDDEGDVVSRPLTAWGVNANGNVIPLVASWDGTVEDIRDDYGYFVAVMLDGEGEPPEEMVEDTKRARKNQSGK